MAATLDRKKPYGESLGHPHIKFLQNNKLFNEQGDEINANGQCIKDLEAAKVEAEAKAQAAADAEAAKTAQRKAAAK